MKTIDPIKRFWTKVLKTQNCWIWTAYKDKDGYGTFPLTHKKTVKAHRYSYILAFKNIKKGMCVLHKCDNPSCVNPSHLFLGSVADNMTDRNAKNRQAKGEKFRRSNLTTQNISDIRSLYKDGLTEQTIANLFHISQPTISRIILKQIWKHI